MWNNSRQQHRTKSSAYFASSVSAIVPDTTGVAALVPSKSVTHSPSPPVVAFTNGGIHKHLTSLGYNGPTTFRSKVNGLCTNATASLAEHLSS